MVLGKIVCQNKKALNFGTQFYLMRLLFFICFLILCNTCKAQSPTDAALCFYQWYLQAIKGKAQTHTALVKKGTAGETLLDYQVYFQQLDSLDCVTEKFKRSEQARFQACQDFFKGIPYLEYYDNIDNNPNFYDTPCPFFTQYFWVGDINLNWKIIKAEEQEPAAQVLVLVELGAGTNRQVRGVTLVQEAGKWKIDKIL